MIGRLLKATFDQYYDLPLPLWESLASAGEEVFVKKDAILKRRNGLEHNLNFILRGSAGVLLYHEGNFICTDLMLENEFACDYLSFISRQLTPSEVLTFEDSQLFRISYKEFEKFTNESEFGDKIWRYATQALYIDKQLQQQQVLTMTATERYQLMLQHQPHIIQRIPLKYISSFLGVTPQSLSRLRKLLTKKK